jgi:18S rRNA (guanine1575-N7)-methyltransferase
LLYDSPFFWNIADVLSEAGHMWTGLDISPSMLDIAVEREVEGETLLADMGQGFGFRAGMFDGAIRSVLIFVLSLYRHAVICVVC